MATLFGPGSIELPLYGAGMAYKTENGLRFPREAFAYAPHGSQPSEWKLRLWESPQKKMTAHQVGMAIAALGKGFRGNKVSIPTHDVLTVKRRVLRAWHAVNPGSDDIPDVLKNLDAGFEGIAPPGWEPTIKKMKKDTQIDNPFALAWWLKNRGAKPAKHDADMSASADAVALLRALMRQQHQIPSVCMAAAHGEAWAQAQLLAPDCPPLIVDGQW